MATTANNSIETTVINTTNQKISEWYTKAAVDCGVVGQGACRIEGDQIIVDYTENGEEKTWSMAYYPEYVEDNGVNYFYNVWEEEA